MSLFDKERKEVLDACLWLSEQGFFGSLRGSGGNISVRLGQNAMAITPSGVRYQEMHPEDICIIGKDNSAIEIKAGFKPSMEAGLHNAVYRNRSDVNAVVHTHQLYGSVFAILNMPIPALFDEVSSALGKTVDVIPYALSGSPELAANVGEKLSSHANTYIIQNHGILALGKTLDQAILHAELLEKVAHIYYLALSTAKPITGLPASTINVIAAMHNSDIAEALK